MKASSRKILKKIGAGLMLGLSLFNLGAAWSKAEGWNLAKRSKNLRVKEKDQIESEMTIFAEVAEEEALRAIQEKSALQQEQFTEEASLTVYQKIYRASAIGILSVALGIFATSMLLNLPFALGKGMLSLLPGNPHLAKLALSVDKESVSVGDEFIVKVNLDSAGEKVDSIKLVLNYNPNLVSFENDSIPTNWEIKENQIDKKRRELILITEKKKFEPKIFIEEDFMELSFKTKNLSAGEDLVFSLNRAKSLVVASEAKIEKNILGEVHGTKITVFNKEVRDLKCQKLNETIGTIDFWKNFVKGDLSMSRENYWQKIDTMGMICAHNNDYIYITIVYSGDNSIDNFEINSRQIQQKMTNADYFWEEGDFKFFLYQFASNGLSEIDNLEIKLTSEFFNKKQWPIEGTGKLILEQ